MSAPCVGCGFCCMKTPCGLSRLLFDKRDCPALHWQDSRYVCDLASVYPAELRIGAGCCCNLNTWRRDVRNRDGERSSRLAYYVNRDKIERFRQYVREAPQEQREELLRWLKQCREPEGRSTSEA